MSLYSFKKTKVGRIIWEYYMVAKKPYVACKNLIKVRKLKNVVQSHTKNIFFCGVCETSNMGDLVQTYCIRSWLLENYREYNLIELRTSLIMDCKQLVKMLNKVVGSKDIFFFQSGYNTHDLGGREDLMHQKIMMEFPENYMIMMPQTVYFKSEERKEQCSKIYNGHKKLFFFARDYQSLKISEKMFPDIQVSFLPDIVSSLIGHVSIPKIEKQGILLCRRYDIEQFYTEEDYKKIEQRLSKFDNVNVEDTIVTVRNNAIAKDIEKYMDEMIMFFSKYKLVVTDKFHGLIFSLIANTPVVVLRTKDHKVTGGYELFHKSYPDYVFFADSYDEIEAHVEHILCDGVQYKLGPYYYNTYYKDLRNQIETWRRNKL